MQVKRIVVHPRALEAGRLSMHAEFTTEDVVDAILSANRDAGVDVGEFSGEEFARLVADRLLKDALAAERIKSVGRGFWRSL